MGDYFSNFGTYWDVFFGGLVIAKILLLGIVAIFILFAFYIYHSLAWMRIAKSLKYKHPWLAWIPLAEWAMRLHLGKISWAWIFLIFVPIIGWLILLIFLSVATWRIFESKKFYNWLSLSYPAIFIPTISHFGIVIYIISIGILAWNKNLKKR